MPHPSFRADVPRGFPGKAWLVNGLRVLHLAGVVGVGAGILFGIPAPSLEVYLVVLIASGAAILFLDVWSKPAYLAEFKGVGMLVKLALAVALVYAPQWRVPLFWLILALSVFVSHAPSRWRNRRLLG